MMYLVVLFLTFQSVKIMTLDPIKKLRDAYHPLFQRYGIDILFSGHAHNYQRTYPLFYNDVNSSEPIIEQNAKTEYKSPKGSFR
jgi:hypothetical protein